ncbi:MAG: glycosyltransferase family 2 protein [Bradymonadales bacterium]|nr:glycosyltransferase family 2 protein [Bradymonadales bacterium]
MRGHSNDPRPTDEKPAAATEAALPPVSVVIRSLDRLDACLELIGAVLDQDYPSFEVIVVEQSRAVTAEQQTALQRLCAEHDNLTVLRCSPLGPAGARNMGWRNANNPIVLFIDDDDLPLGTDWIRKHGEQYLDPDIIGVSGRELNRPDDPGGYWNHERAVRNCLSYNFLAFPSVYCRLGQRIDPVQWLHGGNASVRREWIEAAGGWDENLVDHEEHTFAFRLRPLLEPPQRLIFDPGPTIIRRRNLPGGIDRRSSGPFAIYRRQFDYFHRVVARYRPWRLLLLYPVVLVWMVAWTIRWFFKDSRSHARLSSRLAATMEILLCWPIWYLACWILMIGKAPRRKKRVKPPG